MPEQPLAPEAAHRIRQDGLTWQVVADQVVVLDLLRSRYLEMNASGALLFQAVAEGATVEELVARLQHRYQVSRDRAEVDAVAFLEHLRQEGLLER